MINKEITEDYVSFASAKLLREKGFDGRCFSFYWSDGSLDANSHDKHTNLRNSTSSNPVAPTLQMAMKWLCEDKGIAIIPIISSILDNEKFLWDIKIVVAKTGDTYSQGWVYEKLEQAFEHAINYSLENLI